MIWCFKTGRSQKGFTLIEILVVMMVVSLVMGLVAPSVFNSIERVRRQSEQKILSSIIDKAETLSFCRSEPITIFLDKFRLKIEGPGQKILSTRTFSFLHFETAKIVFNENGFPETRELRYRINDAHHTFRF